MGLRGPAPKPTALRILEGNRSKSPLNAREPQFDSQIPICPPHLDAQAKKEWARLAPALVQVKILTEVDYMALGNLCQAYSTMAQAQKLLNKQGILLEQKIKTPKDQGIDELVDGKKPKKKPGRPKRESSGGIFYQNPLLTVVNRQAEIIVKYCREFGLTPSSRSRLTVDTKPDVRDSLEDALGA
jgi:P27 family predicted phage terminase small subunit